MSNDLPPGIVLILGQRDVRELLTMRACMDAMAAALRSLAQGQVILPLRPVMWLPDKFGALGMMPAHSAALDRFGVKVVSVFPSNHGTPYDAHQGTVMLFEAKHGRLLALMDATEITAIRTAAVSGVATQTLANPEAGDLAILGSGTQARTHLRAMAEARTLGRIRVWSRSEANARAFAAREAKTLPIAIEVCDTARAAVAGADLICTTTSSPEPVLLGEWLAPGVHINAVGSSVAHARELDAAAMSRGRLYVDRRESTLNESGDFLMAKRDGALTDASIQGELGEVLLGSRPGRVTAAEITIFKSLGIAIEDLASAEFLYRRALALGAGQRVEMGGGRLEE
ncbi:MAG: ornithine cyclodeaminase family protein [Thermoflexales bacterium]